MVAHRASEASNNGTGATTITMDKPSGVVDGDTMLMGVTARGGTGVAITPPAVFGTATMDTNAYGNVGENRTSAFSPDSRYFWYCATSQNKVFRVDNLDNSKVGISVSSAPNFMVMSEDGAFLYVISAPGAASYIDVIDTASMTKLTSVNRWSYGTPYDVLVIGSNLYVANGGANGYVDVWALTSSTPWASFTANVSLGSDGISRSLATDDTYLYVGSVNYKVAVMKLSDRSIDTTLTFSANASNVLLAATPDKSKIWCTGQSGDAEARAITTSSRTWASSVILLGTGANGCGGIVVTADGKYVYVTGKNYTYVYSITNATNAYRNQILGGYFEYNPQTEPDGQHVLVLEYSTTAAKIKRIRCYDDTVVDTWNAENYTRSMLLSPDGRYLWAYQGWHTTFNKLKLWAPLGFPFNSTTVLQQHIWWKIADSEASTYSVKFSSSQLASGVIVALDATVAKFEPEQYGGVANASSTSVSAPAIGTWTSADGVDVGIFGTAYGTTFTPPSNYTEPATADDKSTGTTTATATEGAYRALTGVTSIGTIAAEAANAAVNIAHHIFVSQNLLVNRFSLATDPTLISIARGTEDTVDVNTSVVSGNAEAITLDATGEPSGVTVTFGTNPVTAGNTSVMTVALNGTVTEIDHIITVAGSSASYNNSTTFTLRVYSNPAPIDVHFIGSSM